MAQKFERRADCGILDVRLNEDCDMFVCSLQSGLRVYSVHPLSKIAVYDEKITGSLKQADMYRQSSFIALMSGGRKPRYQDNYVSILNTQLEKEVMRFVLPHKVLNVRLTDKFILIIMEDTIHIYTCQDVSSSGTLVKEVATRKNPKGLCVATPASAERGMLAFPSTKGVGCLELHSFASLEQLQSKMTGPSSSTVPVIIDAHKHELACAVFNASGTLVATASGHGTLIRIFETKSKSLLTELRRGSDPANLFSLNFSPNSEFLCASSDKGTVHIFAVKEPELNRQGTLGVVTQLMGASIPKWSLASFVVPPICACQVAFVDEWNVVAVCVDGTYHKFRFTRDGQCVRDAYDVFLDRYEHDNF